MRDTTLTVGTGEFVSVVGPTGCGKSTLLNIAAGLLDASSGSVRVLGEPLAGINRHAGCILVLTAFALALDAVVTAVEDRLLVWRPAQGETERL